MEIASPYDRGVMALNRPSGRFSLEHRVVGLERFEVDFILQTMFLRSPEYDSSDMDNISAWMDIVRRLKPREVMVYTIDRETPQKDLVKFAPAAMEEMVRPLKEEGFNIQVRG